MLSKGEAKKVIDRFADMRILVVGDLMLDRYVFGSVNRISPEAPVPVVHVTREASRPGGASNVSLNIASMGGSSTIAGIIGRDEAGQALLNTFDTTGIETDGIVRDGEISLPAGPGLGIELNEDILGAYALAPDTPVPDGSYSDMVFGRGHYYAIPPYGMP